MGNKRFLVPALVITSLSVMLAADVAKAQPQEINPPSLASGPNGDGAPSAQPFDRRGGAGLTVGPTGIFVPGPSPTPGFAGTTIDFEDFDEATAISGQFSNLGVTFSQNDTGTPEIDNNPFHFAYESAAPAGGGMLVGGTGGGAALAAAGIVAEFSPPVARVGAYLSDTGPLGTYTITIFDSAGAVLDTISVDPVDFPTIPSFPNPDPSCDDTAPWEGTGCGVWVGFDFGSASIAKIQFGPSTVPTTDRFGIDDLVFDAEVDGPDLTVSSFTQTPANPSTADTIVLTAVVENVGNEAAGGSTACIDIGGETCDQPTTEMLFAVPALVAGASHDVVRTVELDVAQSYLNNAVADLDDDVVESDETNNTATNSFTVTDAAPASLIYQIISLPANGTLAGLSVCSAANPCNLANVMVTYEPAPTFTGTDFFEYRILDVSTGLFSAAAIIDLLVANPPGTGVTLTVDFLGSGDGDVSFDVGGSVVAICSDDCTESFGPGDIVKLQARPLGLSTFGSWGGACSIGGSSQIVTITLPASGGSLCEATFNP